MGHLNESGSLKSAGRSYSQIQLAVYQKIIDLLYSFSVTKMLLFQVVFPYAHYFMLTI